jgi:hypothetical protein
MKPTQEQIEAALRYAEERDTRTNAMLLGSINPRRMISFNALTALAAAYRAAIAENEQLKAAILKLNQP